jgi:hypothetical protein
MPALRRLTLFVCCVMIGTATLAARGGQAAAEGNAKTWLDNRQAFEDYLRIAEANKMEEIGVGVTKPRRVYLAPGGPVDRMAWKTITPGIHEGYWESYKSEIAAYELDKLLGLDMVPPTVERRLKGDLGAAVMWVSPTKSFKELGGPPSPPPAKHPAWNRQLIRAKMFDNLIANVDPNLGNWLVDPSWNLILIDHTRAFTTRKDMVHQFTRVDRELWERMKGLTAESLTTAVGKWIGGREVRAILERRDRMQTLIDKLIAANGESDVFVQ